MKELHPATALHAMQSLNFLNISSLSRHTWLLASVSAFLATYLGSQSLHSRKGAASRLVAAGTVAACVIGTKNVWVAACAVAGLLVGPRLTCIGLTGGIAAGKSAVSAELQKGGATIVDADLIAREIVRPGKPALVALVKRFGIDILAEDGTLDRKVLRARTFGDATARRALNGIMHPAIAKEMLRQVAVHRWLRGETVFIDAPLLFESGLLLRSLCSPIVCVTAPDEERIARVMARDGVSREAAVEATAAQMPQDVKARMSDVVIANDGSLAQLQAKARTLLG